MKILVISDTHGNTGKAKKIWASHDGLDLVIHLGDYYSDAEELATSIKTEVVAVPGNMDRECDAPKRKMIETEYGPVLITHGHREKVKQSYDNLLYSAEEAGCKAVLFGHTHAAVHEEIDGIHIINPGSLSYPRDGNPGSYALITTSPDSFDCRIIYLKDKKPKNSAGLLRSLLNYSDRL